MINTLEVKNFKNLLDFKIADFKRVNLIVGKNNTGKTTLLEAISIAIQRNMMAVLNDVMNSTRNTRIENGDNISAEILWEYFGLLYPFKSLEEKFHETEFFSTHNQLTNKVSFRPMQSSLGEMSVHIKVNEEEEKSIELYDLPRAKRLINDQNIKYTCHFVRTKDINNDKNVALWDNITLTLKESEIIKALQIIDKNIEAISFVGSENNSRTAKIRLSTHVKPIPLSSMGDGINHLLSIILALVNVENGILLIDEFETGLHYTAQRKLWEIIFTLSQKLNIQVFATTHSLDTIRTFQQVLNETNPKEGQLIRLQNKNGEIVHIDFDAEELAIANDNDIDVR